MKTSIVENIIVKLCLFGNKQCENMQFGERGAEIVLFCTYPIIIY